jgi:F-type H+-transporting ATPase subunit gamma
MAAGKELRVKIKSFESTKKITKAMEMISASKMRKVQARMSAARPYADKIRNIAANLSQANPDYRSPYMRKVETPKNIGFIIVTSDKGLCGGLNTNLLRAVSIRMGEVQQSGGKVHTVALGNKGYAFLTRIGARVMSFAVHLGDAPNMDKLFGPVKVMLDAFAGGEIDAVQLCYTKFINSMAQQPMVEQLLPLSGERLQQSASEKAQYAWDYIYEPDPPSVIDALLTRYLEALVYQAVAENMASEQSARRVAMKAATDNATDLIAELQLIYNKTRQAGITTELSEIVGGAAAISG